MIVVDTNVLAYFWIPGIYTEEVEELYEFDSDWNAPLLWRSELRNVLVNYVRRDRMTPPTALEIMEEAEVQLESHSYAVSSDDVLRLSLGSRCTAYDCEFVVLARDLGTPLITTDGRILQEFPDTAVSPGDFVRSGGKRA